MRRLSSFRPASAFSSLAGVALLAAATSLSAQQPQEPTTISREVKEVFDRCSKAVVKIDATDQHGELSGTGFFVDPMGTLYTAYSVGGEASNISVEFKGKKYPARQLMADLRSGIALLKIDLASPALPIGSSGQMEIATPVVTIGYPLDLSETPSFGMIAGFDRKCLGGYFSTTHMRVNLPPQRGEGGAPLLNLKGEVVGILLYSFENNSCYALPIEAAEKLRSDYVRFGEARYGWIGTNVQESATPVEGSRAVTTEVMKDTPAAEAGLKPGDVVLQIGRTKVHEPEDILEASFFLTAGDAVPITVARGNEKITFQIQAESHPTRLAAPPSLNRTMPLNLQSMPEGTP
ncbi:MAG TPA: trypsin-like peptidase domain-containing protein [Chthoniobacterales bacterium]|nr:trypsin-like peptidase domain-containing protein [Chthoniobacterales bacterium]